jgi:glycosyltransferase involved in cell wall biosynthesis
VRRLAELPGVEVHADVPDLGPFLQSARVAVAPMSSGSGVPMKVLEALAAGVPAVAHPRAAEGLSGEGGKAVAAPANAAEWVEELERLLTDSEAARDLGERGHALWQRVYRPERVAEQIRQVIAEAAGEQVRN